MPFFSKDIDEASDLTQDILVKTLEHLDDFKGESKFSTWLYSITVNHCIVYAKKKQRHHYQGLEEIENLSECFYLAVHQSVLFNKQYAFSFVFLKRIFTKKQRQLWILLQTCVS